MQRRDFIRVSGVGGMSVLVTMAGCGGGQGGNVTVIVPPGSGAIVGGIGGGGGVGTAVGQSADVVLTNDSTQMAQLLSGGVLQNRIATVMSTPEQFSQKPNNVVRIAIGTDVIDLWADDISFLESTKYRRIVAQRQSDGDIVEFHLETDGLSPKLVLRRRSNGQRVATVGFSDVARRSRLPEERAQLTAANLLSIGTQVFAVALAIWLGASIGRAVLGALAFIAFNAMIIGIVLAAIGLALPFIRALLDFLGIQTLGDVTAFFRRVVDDLRLLFDQVVSFLRSFLPELSLRSSQLL